MRGLDSGPFSNVSETVLVFDDFTLAAFKLR